MNKSQRKNRTSPCEMMDLLGWLSYFGQIEPNQQRYGNFIWNLIQSGCNAQHERWPLLA